MEPDQISGLIASWAIDKPLILKIWLFGSRVRRDYRLSSDLDIAVELDPAEYGDSDESGGLATWMFEKNGWLAELQALVPYSVQLEQYRGNQTPTIKRALVRSSVLVYEKQA